MRSEAESTVFVVDDDEAVRDAILELLESVGLRGEAYASAQAFLDGFRDERPGCLVLDIRMAGMSGLQLQEKLKEREAKLPVLFLSGHADVPLAVRAMQNGATDFVEKPYSEQRLLDCINNALAADAFARVARRDEQGMSRHLKTLTKRERDVLNVLLQGGTSKQVARELGISPRTVETHRHNLLRKFDVDSFRELMLNRTLLEE